MYITRNIPFSIWKAEAIPAKPSQRWGRDTILNFLSCATQWTNIWIQLVAYQVVGVHYITSSYSRRSHLITCYYLFRGIQFSAIIRSFHFGIIWPTWRCDTTSISLLFQRCAVCVSSNCRMLLCVCLHCACFSCIPCFPTAEFVDKYQSKQASVPCAMLLTYLSSYLLTHPHYYTHSIPLYSHLLNSVCSKRARFRASVDVSLIVNGLCFFGIPSLRLLAAFSFPQQTWAKFMARKKAIKYVCWDD